MSKKRSAESAAKIAKTKVDVLAHTHTHTHTHSLSLSLSLSLSRCFQLLFSENTNRIGELLSRRSDDIDGLHSEGLGAVFREHAHQDVQHDLGLERK